MYGLSERAALENVGAHVLVIIVGALLGRLRCIRNRQKIIAILEQISVKGSGEGDYHYLR